MRAINDGQFSPGDLAGIRAVEQELSTIVDGSPFVLATIAAPLRDLLGTDSSCSYSFVQQGEGLKLEYFHTQGWPKPERATRVFADHVRDKVVGWGWYNPIRPEERQQNKALRCLDLGKHPDEYPDHLARMGAGGMDQLRVLVCEGPSLLAWVGAMQHDLFDAHQKRLLQRLVPALQKRLVIEKRLARATLLGAAFSATLDAIGSPAFLITPAGRIVEMNALGARLESRDKAKLAVTLVDCARRPERAPNFNVTRVLAGGCAEHFLVVARPNATTELEQRTCAAARRWQLTARQARVLDEVAQGFTNRVVAATLGVAEGTIELHLTAIFEKAQVENRAELVTKVWRGS